MSKLEFDRGMVSIRQLFTVQLNSYEKYFFATYAETMVLVSFYFRFFGRKGMRDPSASVRASAPIFVLFADPKEHSSPV